VVRLVQRVGPSAGGGWGLEGGGAPTTQPGPRNKDVIEAIDSRREKEAGGRRLITAPSTEPSSARSCGQYESAQVPFTRSASARRRPARIFPEQECGAGNRRKWAQVSSVLPTKAERRRPASM